MSNAPGEVCGISNTQDGSQDELVCDKVPAVDASSIDTPEDEENTEDAEDGEDADGWVAGRINPRWNGHSKDGS